MNLVEAFYVISAELPKEETYGLKSQMRGAAVSVAASIAEGAARHSTQELIQFPYMANGSLSELNTHLEVAKRLGYFEDTEALQQQLDGVQGQLLAVIQSLKRRRR